MLARKTILGAVAVLIVGLLLAGQSVSQPRQRGQRGGAQGAQGAQGPQRQGLQGRQFDPQQMRQMMEQRIRQQLGATEQEWKVLGPCVMEVSELSRQLSAGGRGGMMFGGVGGRPGGPQGGRPGGMRGAPDAQQTELEKAIEQLRTMLENTSTPSGEIKKQLTVVRAAKEKHRQKLVAAQEKLRKLITMRQEGLLYLMGMLD